MRGDATAMMQRMTKGTRVILSGPFGVFTQEMRTKRDVVLIAAGIGIPPVRALAEGLAATAGDISILYRTRDENDAPLLDELREISELRGHNLRLASGSRPTNGQWLSHSNISDETQLLQMFPTIRQADVYLCGPVEFTHRVEQTLQRLGIPKTSIHSEEYAW
jgi:ferredoxin-NADP reductase